MSAPRQSLHHPSHRPAASNLRIERWQRRALYASVALLTLSGLVWIFAHYFWRPVTQFGEGVSPLEPLSMKLHGAAAIALFFFVGSILNGHIRRALKTRRNRLTGWSMAALLTVLTLSGYALYYLASENSRSLWSLVHWIPGCLLALALALHVRVGRRTAR